MRANLFKFAAAVAVLVVQGGSAAWADDVSVGHFRIHYVDDSTAGFNDPVNGVRRRQRFEDAASNWSEKLPVETQPIDVRLRFESFGNCRFLGQTTDPFQLFEHSDGLLKFYPTALGNTLGLRQVIGGTPEFSIQFNSEIETTCGQSFDYQVNGGFFRISLHEIGHGLGFDADFISSSNGVPFEHVTSDHFEWHNVGLISQMILNQRHLFAATAGENAHFVGKHTLAAAALRLPPPMGSNVDGLDVNGHVVLHQVSGMVDWSHISASAQELMSPRAPKLLNSSILTLPYLRDVGWGGCPGDCDSDLTVTPQEIDIGVEQLLSRQPPAPTPRPCPAVDCDGVPGVRIHEIYSAMQGVGACAPSIDDTCTGGAVGPQIRVRVPTSSQKIIRARAGEENRFDLPIFLEANTDAVAGFQADIVLNSFQLLPFPLNPIFPNGGRCSLSVYQTEGRLRVDQADFSEANNRARLRVVVTDFDYMAPIADVLPTVVVLCPLSVVGTQTNSTVTITVENVFASDEHGNPIPAVGVSGSYSGIELSCTEDCRLIADCNNDCAVTVDELVQAVNIALGNQLVMDCSVADHDFSGIVEIHELVGAVGASLNGCPSDSGAGVTPKSGSGGDIKVITITPPSGCPNGTGRVYLSIN